MTENQRLLLQQILVNPAEDSIRLMYADCIEENGEVDRAEFIRVQCEIAKSPEPALLCMNQLPGFEKKKNQKGGTCTVCKADEECKYHTLRRRERELWTDGVCLPIHESVCFLPGSVRTSIEERNLGLRGWNFYVSRGFISHITCTAEDWLKYADQLVWREGMTDPCPECNDESTYRIYCTKCEGSGKAGRVPRPMPETAQPIEKVVLTTEPYIAWHEQDRQREYGRELTLSCEFHGQHLSQSRYIAFHELPPANIDMVGWSWNYLRQNLTTKYVLEQVWPGIEFEIQNTGNVPDDFQQILAGADIYEDQLVTTDANGYVIPVNPVPGQNQFVLGRAMSSGPAGTPIYVRLQPI